MLAYKDDLRSAQAVNTQLVEALEGMRSYAEKVLREFAGKTWARGSTIAKCRTVVAALSSEGVAPYQKLLEALIRLDKYLRNSVGGLPVLHVSQGDVVNAFAALHPAAVQPDDCSDCTDDVCVQHGCKKRWNGGRNNEAVEPGEKT